MSTASTMDRTSHDSGRAVSPPLPAPEPVTLHRRRGALALIGVGAAAAGAAYLWRGVSEPDPFGYLVAVVLLPVAALHLAAWWDARAPLLVADETGVRLREGRTWTGLRWDEVDALSLAPSRLPRRDARLDVGAAGGTGRPLPLALVDPSDVRALPEALRGLAPSSVQVVVAEPASDDVGTGGEVAPGEQRDALSGATSVPGVAPGAEDAEDADDAAGERGDAARWGGELAGAAAAESDDRGDSGGVRGRARGAATWWSRRRHTEAVDSVVASDPAAEPTEPWTSRWTGRWTGRSSGQVPAEGGASADHAAEDVPGEEPWTPRPSRVARADVVVEGAAGSVSPARGDRDGTESAPLDDAPVRAPLAFDIGDDADGRGTTGGGLVPGTPSPESDSPVGRAPAPVIGPRLAQGRTRLRLSVDDLAERTRIRPHVIEAIEVDDFSACGGDIYARGHLRVLARVLGVDPDALVGDYDQRYSAGPVIARKVFEAELAGPGRSMRTTSGGPRWSVLIGVVLVLVLLWGLVRLLVPSADGVADGRDPARGQGIAESPDSARTVPGPAEAAASFADMGERATPTRLQLRGVPGSAAATPVTVRLADGVVLFRGAIGSGDVERLQVSGPVTVVAQDAGAVTAVVDGRVTGPLGETGRPIRRTLAAG